RHRRRRVVDSEADELARQPLGVLDLDGAAADVEWLGLADRPGHVGLVGMREAIGILADDDVTLFQTENALRLDAEGTDALRLAGFHERVPDMLATMRGHVDLVAELTNESHTQQTTRHARHGTQAHAQIWECLWREIDIGAKLLQHRARA